MTIPTQDQISKSFLTRSTTRVSVTLVVLVLLLSALLTEEAVGQTYSLYVSTAATRSNAVPLQGQSIAGNMYVIISPATGIIRVRFFLDNPSMSGAPRQVENNAPYDFAGTAGDGSGIPFSTTQIATGSHTITAAVDLAAGGTEVVNATFSTANDLSEASGLQVHLAWVSHSSSTLTVVWRTADLASPSAVEYRRSGDTAWQSAVGVRRPSGTSGTLHEVTFTSLSPSTSYEYRVSDGPFWSDVFTTRTAPPVGPADFDFVYFADTGLIGRLDGLATGTEQVISEIAKLNPLFVLPGGDYAYFDTDERFGSLENTIDAWFDQMQPIATRSPMMPTYGNHEALLGEGFDEWAARFPTPEGFDNRRNYSFDVGEVHFVSIFAVEDEAGLSSGTLNWIQQDIIAARKAGKRWIIPYFHVSPFADGTNHSSNLNLRAQLGPLFESLGVKLVLSSHDQAYERTFPLTDVPATNTPTSASKTCYTMNDGITWVKVSPGGKLSNISLGFSPFASNPAPPWTAVRNNMMHNFARIVIATDGSLRLEAYGVKGDGTPPIIFDSFQYTFGNCPGALEFNPNGVSFTVPQGGTAPAQTANLTTSNGTAASFTVSENAPWLTVSPTAGTTPASLSFSVNATGLTPGTYTTNVNATASDYGSASLNVTLTVTSTGGGGGSYNLLLSAAANRSSPVSLQGQSLTGNRYIFISPEIGITRVRFFLDNPSMSGPPRQLENTAPYDFAGGAVSVANPFDTTQLPDGSHTITAAVDLASGGTEVVNAAFTVSNNAPALAWSSSSVSFTAPQGGMAPAQTVNLTTSNGTAASFTVSENAPWLTVTPTAGTTPATLTFTANANGLTPGTYTSNVSATASGYGSASLNVTLTVTSTGGGGASYSLMVSATANRSSPVSLQGQSLTGNRYIFISSETGITRVRFFLDNPSMSGAPRQVENTGPYDFAGGTVSVANPFDTTQLPDGSHTITAAVDLLAGSTEVVNATVMVVNK